MRSRSTQEAQPADFRSDTRDVALQGATRRGLQPRRTATTQHLTKRCHMGSRARDSSGRKAARSRPATKVRAKDKNDLFRDAADWITRALSIIATATKALVHAQERTGTLKPED